MAVGELPDASRGIAGSPVVWPHMLLLYNTLRPVIHIAVVLSKLRPYCAVKIHVPVFKIYNSSHESEGVCFTGVGLCVCLSVYLSVTTLTKKIVEGFVPTVGYKTPKFRFRGELYSFPSSLKM